jgi:hypothetical protein
MAIIFDLLKDLLIWVMTFVEEDVTCRNDCRDFMLRYAASLQLLPGKMFYINNNTILRDNLFSTFCMNDVPTYPTASDIAFLSPYIMA